jgi:PAS domain S-box-containing protein
MHEQRCTAMVMGNRAGVIEWANEGWGQLVGLPAHATLEKPLGSLLQHHAVSPEAVDWVSRRFLAGETCEIELSIRPPGSRGERWLHVRVEPLRDDAGDVTHFIAYADDISELSHPEPETVEECDLSLLVREVAVPLARELGALTRFDPALARELPPAYANRFRVGALVQHLIRCAIRAIGTEWGTISLTTGLLGLEPEPISPGNPAAGLPLGPYMFVEIHDTALTDREEALSRIRGPFLPAIHPPRGQRFPNAIELARELGGRVDLIHDGPPGTGIILVLPA